MRNSPACTIRSAYLQDIFCHPWRDMTVKSLRATLIKPRNPHHPSLPTVQTSGITVSPLLIIYPPPKTPFHNATSISTS